MFINLLYVINFDKYKSMGPDWMAWYVIDNNVTYFHSTFIFQKKLENPLELKILHKVLIEYRHMIK